MIELLILDRIIDIITPCAKNSLKNNYTKVFMYNDHVKSVSLSWITEFDHLPSR